MRLHVPLLNAAGTVIATPWEWLVPLSIPHQEKAL